MKTYSARPETIKKDWYVVDAKDQILGRLAAQVAHRLRGKHRPEYTPHVDTGDFIVIINSDKIKVSGNKFDDKIYYHHTGYIGGIKSQSFGKLLARRPNEPLIKAVKGMLPKGPLGRVMLKKLKVYSGELHPHTAQQPTPLTL